MQIGMGKMFNILCCQGIVDEKNEVLLDLYWHGKHKKTDDTKYYPGATRMPSLLMGTQMVQALWRTVWQRLTKLNKYPAILLQVIYSIGFKTYLHTKTCI